MGTARPRIKAEPVCHPVVRKSGVKEFPWEARCRLHVRRELYFFEGGACAFNTHGIGNRRWDYAQLSAMLHVRKHALLNEFEILRRMQKMSMLQVRRMDEIEIILDSRGWR